MADVPDRIHTTVLLSAGREHGIVAGRRRCPMPITITITSGMLLAFFWAFWIFAFAGWWCGGPC